MFEFLQEFCQLSLLATIKDLHQALKGCKTLLVCPEFMREKIEWHIDREIAEAKAGRKAEIIIKVNSLSDRESIEKLYEAAEAGVTVKMIVRGIYCAMNSKKFKKIRFLN